jgi:hypothetical protein
VPQSCVHFVGHDRKYIGESSFFISLQYKLRRLTLRSRVRHTPSNGLLVVPVWIREGDQTKSTTVVKEENKDWHVVMAKMVDETESVFVA